MDGSGSNPNQGKDPYSASLFPTDEPAADPFSYLILIVEDNPADVFLIHDCIQASGIKARAHLVNDGEKAIQFFDYVDHHSDAPCPDLVILDINLPRRTGRDVLRYLRQSQRCASVAVIVATTSNIAGEREELIRLGASRYFQKPSEYDEFLKLAGVIQELFPSPPQSGPGVA